MSQAKDKLLDEYNKLTVKLNDEYEELAERRRIYQQEVDSLLKITSKINEWVFFVCFKLEILLYLGI